MIYFVSIDAWSQVAIFTRTWIRCGRCKMLGQVVFWVELSVQRRLCPDFREWCQVTRHPRVFRGLTGCQRTPRKWGVTTSFILYLPSSLSLLYSLSLLPLSHARIKISVNTNISVIGFYKNIGKISMNIFTKIRFD